MSTQVADLKGFSSRPQEIALIDKDLKSVRNTEQRELESFLSSQESTTLVREYAHMVLRLALSKGASSAFPVKVKNGPMDEDRLADLKAAWKHHITTKYKPGPESKWSFVVQEPEVMVQETMYIAEEDEETPEQYLEVLSKGFVEGKHVKLLKRVTGHLADDTRKDVQVNTTGTITSVPKDSSGRVEVSFEVDVSAKGDKKRKMGAVVAKIGFTDLELVVDLGAPGSSQPGSKKQPRSTEAAAQGKTQPQGSAVLQKYPFLEKEDTTPDVLEGWVSKQFSIDDANSDTAMSKAKAQATLAMISMLSETPLTDKELLIVQRTSAGSTGKKAIEVWTKVPFKPGKLILTPYTTEVKDRYWTAGRSALIKSDAIPQGKHLAIDGRLAGKIGADSSSQFSLFWLVERTGTKAEANLTMEYAKVSLQVNVEMGKKQKKHSDSFVEV